VQALPLEDPVRGWAGPGLPSFPSAVRSFIAWWRFSDPTDARLRCPDEDLLRPDPRGTMRAEAAGRHGVGNDVARPVLCRSAVAGGGRGAVRARP
jgi:hypothetical protein